MSYLSKQVNLRHCFAERSSKKVLFALAWGGLLAFLLFVALGPTALFAEPTQDGVIEVTHTVGTVENLCTTTEAIAVPTGTTVYYCFTIRNPNQITLTHHTFALPLFGITRTFEAIIPPGEQLAVTTGFLAESGIFLNPGLSSVINNQDVTNPVTVFSRAENEDEYNYTGQATALVLVGQAQTAVKQTVGTTEANCADASAVAVTSGSTVYYCLTITNTGSLDFARHEIVAPQLGATFVYTPTDPTANTQQITAQQVRQDYQPNRLEKVIDGNFANTISVTSYTSDGIAAENSATAKVILGSTTAVLTYTVGIAANECATATSASIPTNSIAYFCATLKNTGTLPFERFTINAPQLGLQRTFTRTVVPGATMVLTQSFDTKFAKTVTVNETNSITIDAFTADNISVQTQRAATVTAGNLLLTVNKYARSTPDGCVTTPPLTINSTTQFYYCVVIKNTGLVPIESFTVTEPTPTNINFSFDYRLEPNQTITLTNIFLAQTLNLGSYLGPFLTSTSSTPSLTVTARSANSNPVPASSAFQLIVNIPTNTPVPTPTPSLTWTPTLTPIPTTTPTVPPTPTPTNVVVSVLPSATNVLGLDTVATPISNAATATPPGFVPESPLVDSALATPTPTFDFVATDAAATAVAAAAVAATQTFEAAMTETAVALSQATLATATPQQANTPTVPIEPTATETATAQPALALPNIDGESSAGSIGGNPQGSIMEGDYFSLIAATMATSTATLGWLWFLAGSIIFFAVAGMFAGLSFRQQERRRYRMFDDERLADGNNTLLVDDPLTAFDFTDDASWGDPSSPPDNAGDPNQDVSDRSRNQQTQDSADDDYWPASLP